MQLETQQFISETKKTQLADIANCVNSRMRFEWVLFWIRLWVYSSRIQSCHGWYRGILAELEGYTPCYDCALYAGMRW
jgi:hypothetical protein